MVAPGLNYRMTNIQAAIGCAQLERIDALLETRLRNAAHYAEELEGRGKWLFVVKTANPVRLQEHLRAHGIDARPVFRPLHMTQAFRQSGKFPRSVEEWETGLCLPFDCISSHAISISPGTCFGITRGSTPRSRANAIASSRDIPHFCSSRLHAPWSLS